MATKKSAKEKSSSMFSFDLNQETQAMLNSFVEIEPDTAFLETGNIGFDMALSNGLGMPIGSSVLFWAPPACGKTTLLADVSRRLLAAHKAKGELFKVLYIAVEGSRELLKKMGLWEYYLSRDFLYVERSLCWRQIEQMYDMVLADKGMYAGVKLIIIDSVNNILSDQNVKNSIADGDFGTRSRERGNFYSKYLPMCKMKGISTFMIAQVRQNQDAANNRYAEKKKAAASDADKHNAEIIIKCSADTSCTDVVKLVEETAFGTEKSVERYIMKLDPLVSSSKNRFDRTHKCEIMIEKGVGACNYYALRKILILHKFIKKNGAYYTFDEALCKAFGFPAKSMYKDPLDDIIASHVKELVTFLKEMGCYSVVAADRTTREEMTEEDVEAEKTKETEEEE